MPGKLEGVGKWEEIGNWPLIAVRAAGADQVTEQVQVEAEKHQQGGFPALSGQKESSYGHDDRKQQGVQGVMVLREPQNRMGRVSRNQFRDKPQPIHIRDYCRACHQGTFTAIQGRRIGQKPSCQKVGCRAQEVVSGVSI